MFKKLVLSFLTLSLLLVPSAVSNAKGKDIRPDKVEYIRSEKGLEVPVYYFSNPDDAKVYMEEKLHMTKTEDTYKPNASKKDASKKDDNISIMSTAYRFVDELGVRPYNYLYAYYQNNYDKYYEWSRVIKRTDTQSATIDVGGDFASVFKASVKRDWSTTTSFEDTFKVDVPPRKQAEIWTWNDAKWYLFEYKACTFCSWERFNAIQPTPNYGFSVVITDFRNPGGGY